MHINKRERNVKIRKKKGRSTHIRKVGSVGHKNE